MEQQGNSVVPLLVPYVPLHERVERLGRTSRRRRLGHLRGEGWRHVGVSVCLSAGERGCLLVNASLNRCDSRALVEPLHF